MAGFPGVLRRLGFGPIRKNRSKIKKPDEEVSAEQINLLFWQVAGMNGLVPKAFFVTDGATVTRKWLAWDPDGLLPNSAITIGHPGVGQYTFAFGSNQYADANGSLVALGLDLGQAIVNSLTLAAVVQMNVNGYQGDIRVRSEVDGSASDASRIGVFLYGP
jgi:hypothetical protein